MVDFGMNRSAFLERVREYQHKFELSQTVGADYYEPGMMENLDQYMGVLSDDNSCTIKVDVRGLRYENRSVRLRKCQVGDPIEIRREPENQYNPNNFKVLLEDGYNIGMLPADLCNAMAPLFDYGYISISSARISYIEQLKNRSRYAKQGVMFVEIKLLLRGL